MSSIKERIISKKRHPVDTTTVMGVIQFTVPINEAKSLFDYAQNSSFQIGDKKSEPSDHLALLPKQFVLNLWGTSGPFISKILKPNFYGGSYIIEFFDEEKSIAPNIGRVEIDKIFQAINECPEVFLVITVLIIIVLII